MRNPRRLATAGLLLFLGVAAVVLIYKERRPAAANAPVPTAPRAAVVAYYFHGDQRCPTCLSIERQSRQAIERFFTNEVAAGQLAFRPVNLDQPANRHFVQDYQLETRTLVLASDGPPPRWKSLQEVWTLAHDETRFAQYLKTEVEGFLKEGR